LLGAPGFLTPNFSSSPRSRTSRLLGAEAWRCWQYTATLRIYQRNKHLLSLYQPALLSWFLVLFWFILRLAGCLAMVAGLFKLLLGQKLEHGQGKKVPSHTLLLPDLAYL
jgi:hypothetical protein